MPEPGSTFLLSHIDIIREYATYLILAEIAGGDLHTVTVAYSKMIKPAELRAIDGCSGCIEGRASSSLGGAVRAKLGAMG
jgi:hypothetical protein